MPFDITTLMIGKLGLQGLDEFGRERYARRSLLLDTVTNGRPRVSNSRLLQLPAEMLADIIDRLADDQEALACLALANSDCRQLARCAQFAEIHFDYSPQRRALLQSMAQAALSPTPPDDGIGRCVRRATFASRPFHVVNANKELHASFRAPDKDAYSEDERTRLRAKGNEDYYRMQKHAALAIATAMPNLEVLVWKDSSPLDREFLLSLFQCPARHVKLDGLRIQELSCLEQPFPVAAWPLRSLHTDIMLSGLGDDAEATAALSTFYTRIFQLCAPTLESLRWRFLHHEPNENVLSFGTSPVSFPKLRLLRLSPVSIDGSSLSRSFFTAPLRHLEIWNLTMDDCMATLSGCEPFENLQSLLFSLLPKEKQPWVDAASFLARHTHIKKLSFHEPLQIEDDDAHLDRCIIPVLANNRFDNLSSLSLAWGGGNHGGLAVAHVSTTALAAISTIASLEQLFLSAGMTFGWRRQWPIDHGQLRHHLQGLKKLKKLALSRDSYYNRPDIDLDLYYEIRDLTAQDYVDAEARPELDDKTDDATDPLNVVDSHQRRRIEDQIWEKAHRNRMLAHAEAYAVALPSLEWVYCGQRPMEIVRDSQNSPVPPKAVPLTTKRDECYTFLGKTFGISTDDD